MPTALMGRYKGVGSRKERAYSATPGKKAGKHQQDQGSDVSRLAFLKFFSSLSSASIFSIKKIDQVVFHLLLIDAIWKLQDNC